jgi:hypothetical protein
MAPLHGLLRSLAFAAIFASANALAMGDVPPEGKEAPAAVPSACPEQNAGARGGAGSASGNAACGASGRPAAQKSADDKTPATRPERYGTGFENRQVLGGGGGGFGRGRGR